MSKSLNKTGEYIVRAYFKVRWLAISLLGACAIISTPVAAASETRARDLGIPFEGIPGENNAITDVTGVEVGQVTILRGEGELSIGHGPVRTGITVIHPRGKASLDGVGAGLAVINGTGELTGAHLIEEVGGFFGPIALTGTGNVGTVIKYIQAWTVKTFPAEARESRILPVVGETLDSPLNDVFGDPLKESDVFSALDGAKAGAVLEGNVGGGTGMIAYGFKGGTGTASRVVRSGNRTYTIGVLVQSNHGNREDLRVAGIPVGKEIAGYHPERLSKAPASNNNEKAEKNSLLVIIATDAPMMPHQLKRLARRAALGVGRNGSTAGNLSGEFALAFSTSSLLSLSGDPQFPVTGPVSDLDSQTMNGLFSAAVQATEEALVNQLVASETMTGAGGITVYGLPHRELVRTLRKHRRTMADTPNPPN